jgi:hypothetical protein
MAQSWRCVASTEEAIGWTSGWKAFLAGFPGISGDSLLSLVDVFLANCRERVTFRPLSFYE